MGGSIQLLLPLGERRMSGWAQHQVRRPPSDEPGTDWYAPIGTPVIAPADGRIYGAGNSIKPATGRWVGIDFFNGMRFRCMHHSQLVRVGGIVEAGELIAYSGASGYGEENWSWNPATGGSHSHGTLWPTQVSRYGYNRLTGKPYTIDFMQFAVAGGGGSVPGAPAVDLRRKGNNVIRFLFANNGGPQWTVINLADGVAFRAYTQADGDDLAADVGFSADKVSAQVLANTIALAEAMSGHPIRYIN